MTNIATMVSTTTPVAIAMVVSVLALMAPTALMPMPPAVIWRQNSGHIDHTRWRDINHPGRRGINHPTRNTHLGVNREMADARVNGDRWHHLHRMSATHLQKTQTQQSEQRDSS